MLGNEIRLHRFIGSANIIVDATAVPEGQTNHPALGIINGNFFHTDVFGQQGCHPAGPPLRLFIPEADKHLSRHGYIM